MFRSLSIIHVSLAISDTDECINSPCDNGGSCIDEVAGYTCSCVIGYTGSTCGTGKAAFING